MTKDEVLDVIRLWKEARQAPLAPDEQMLDAFKDVLRVEMASLCVAVQGHLDDLARRLARLEQAVAALIGTWAPSGEAAPRRKAGPRQRRVET